MRLSPCFSGENCEKLVQREITASVPTRVTKQAERTPPLTPQPAFHGNIDPADSCCVDKPLSLTHTWMLAVNMDIRSPGQRSEI